MKSQDFIFIEVKAGLVFERNSLNDKKSEFVIACAKDEAFIIDFALTKTVLRNRFMFHVFISQARAVWRDEENHFHLRVFLDSRGLGAKLCNLNWSSFFQRWSQKNWMITLDRSTFKLSPWPFAVNQLLFRNLQTRWRTFLRTRDIINH